MQVLRRDGTFMDDLDPEHVCDVFPYLEDRFNAIQELKQFEYDTAVITNFGRKLVTSGGMRRVASMPNHVIDHAEKIMGEGWWTDPKNLHRILKMYPQYSFIHGR